MLRQRLITALIALIVVSGVIFLAPVLVFQVLASLLLLAATWEWGSLLTRNGASLTMRCALLISVAVVSAICMLFVPTFWVFLLGSLTVLWGLFAVMRYDSGKTPLGFQLTGLKFLACILLIVPTYFALLSLRVSDAGAGLVFYALTLVIVNDSVAYFAGRAWGKNKLVARVSPKKTWEGCFSGVIGGLVWATVVTLVFWHDTYPLLPMLIAAFITLVASVVGDLFISVLKRQIDLKDTGSVLPGHGGLLDRIDAIIMALPVFALCALCMGII